LESTSCPFFIIRFALVGPSTELDALRIDFPFLGQQAKHAKKLEDEAQAQKASDLGEAEHEARMVAKYGSGPNWYMDGRGRYL
jgi:hypothetical protein